MTHHPDRPAMDREAIAFEFYRFSYPNRWDWPRERQWENFQACRGAVSWEQCIRSADAVLAILALPPQRSEAMLRSLLEKARPYVGGDGPISDQLCTEIDALLAHPSDARGEVVAWRYRQKGAMFWQYQPNKPAYPNLRVFEVEPLYASPPVPGQSDEIQPHIYSLCYQAMGDCRVQYGIDDMKQYPGEPSAADKPAIHARERQRDIDALPEVRRDHPDCMTRTAGLDCHCPERVRAGCRDNMCPHRKQDQQP